MAAEAATFVVGSDDGELAGPPGQAVDFGVQSPTELGAADLRPQDLFPSSSSSSSGGGGGGGDNSTSGEPGPLLSAEEEEGGGVDDPRAPLFPPAAGRRVVVAVALRVDFHAGREAMRLAAFLVMLVAAMSLIGDPDAPRSSQFRALMVWFGGCILLFLLRH